MLGFSEWPEAMKMTVYSIYIMIKKNPLAQKVISISSSKKKKKNVVIVLLFKTRYCVLSMRMPHGLLVITITF